MATANALTDVEEHGVNSELVASYINWLTGYLNQSQLPQDDSWN
jgi:hypothetical protein